MPMPSKKIDTPEVTEPKRFQLKRAQAPDLNIDITGMKIITFELNKAKPLPQPNFIKSTVLDEHFEIREIGCRYGQKYENWLLTEDLQKRVAKGHIIILNERDA
jgi:hypothetical protein